MFNKRSFKLYLGLGFIAIKLRVAYVLLMLTRMLL